MFKTQPIKLDDFSGGLVTSNSEISLTPSQSPDCLNVNTSSSKTVKRRNGRIKLNPTATTGGFGNGMYNYKRTVDEQYLMSLFGSSLQKMDVVDSVWDGTFDVISVSSRGTALSNNLIHYTTFNGDCVMVTESRDIPQKYDPNDNSGLYTDLDWETSHCHVVGDVATIATGVGAYLKLVINTITYDDIDVRSKSTIATVVTAINSRISAQGYAYADSVGYLRVISNTRGASGTVVVSDGTSDSGTATGEATEKLFAGTSQVGTTIGTDIAPSGKYCLTWHDHVWIANTAANPDYLYRSAVSDHTTWTATDFESIYTSSDVGINGLATLRGRMYIFKKWSIHRITYAGGTPLLDIKEVDSSIGTTSPRSIVNISIPGKGEVLAFMGSDKQIYLFDGYEVSPISETVYKSNGISSVYLEGINGLELNKVHAVNDNDNHSVVFFIPITSGSIDIYTKLLLHFDGVNTSTTITDALGINTITNTSVYPEIDYMEYTSDVLAQAAYVSDDATPGTTIDLMEYSTDSEVVSTYESNAYIGQSGWEVAYDSGELAAAVISITISGLNGDVDEEYELIIRQVSAAAGSLAGNITFNSDTTGTNYGYQQLKGSNTTPSASRGTGAMYVSTVAGSGHISFSHTKIHAKSGFVRTAITKFIEDIDGTTIDAIDTMGLSWNNTVDNITQIVINFGTNGAGIGTRAILLKKSTTVTNHAWQEIYTHTVTGSAVTSLTIPSLTGNTDCIYRLRVRHIAGASSNYGLIMLNADTGNNYGTQRITGVNTTVGAARSVGSSWKGYGTGGTNIGDITMYESLIYAKSGYQRTAISEIVESVVTTTVVTCISLYGNTWTNTADEITSITYFDGVSNGLGIGTTISLERLNL